MMPSSSSMRVSRGPPILLSSGERRPSLGDLPDDRGCPERATPVELFEGEPAPIGRIAVEPAIGEPMQFPVIAPNERIEPLGDLEHLIDRRHVRVLRGDHSVAVPEASLLAP